MDGTPTRPPGPLPQPVWEFINPFVAPVPLYGTNEKIGSMGTAQWALGSQEVANETGRLVGEDKES